MDRAVPINVRVVRLDRHVGGRGEKNVGRLVGVGIEEPDGDGDVVGAVAEGDGYGAVAVEEVGASAIVVGEDGDGEVERRIRLD